MSVVEAPPVRPVGRHHVGRHHAPRTTHAAGMRPDIQALRALAVVTVLVFHLWPDLLTGGYIGVDVFFVISGFLITGQLLREAEKTGAVALLGFWAKRARRLLPAALLVLAASAIGTALWVPQNLWDQYFKQIIASTLYVENWLLAAESVDYLAVDNQPTVVQNFWTLSVEEQFYLALPLLLVASIAIFGRSWRSRFGRVLVAGTAASLLFSIYLTATNPQAAFFVTTTRAWEFGLGALLAFVGRQAARNLAPQLAWGGVVMIVAAALFFTEQTRIPGYAALLPVVGTMLVLLATHTTGAFGALSRVRTIRLLGDVSYSIYLWHWPLIVLAPFALGGPLGNAEKVVIGFVSVGLAWLSTRLVEDPIRFQLPRTGVVHARVVGVLALGMAVIVAGCLAAMATVSSQADELPKVVAEARAAAPECFGAASLSATDCARPARMVPPAGLMSTDDGSREECQSTYDEATLRLCTVGATGSASKRMVAIGDSHIGRLTPALEMAGTELGWQIDIIGKQGCYWTSVGPVLPTGTMEKDCTTWRQEVERRLDAQPYDGIIVTHLEGAALQGTTRENRKAVETDGLVDVWSRHAARGVPILALTDVPGFSTADITCVAENGVDAGRECVRDRDEVVPAVDSSVDAARRVPGAVSVDTSSFYCRDTRCSPMIGGVAVLATAGHLTETYSTTLGPLLTPRLKSALTRAEQDR